MSSDRFENWYREYSYVRPFTWTRLTPRHPSEWMSPRRNLPGRASTISTCQPASAIVRRCLRPGPCWGNRHAHALQYEAIVASRLSEWYRTFGGRPLIAAI